MLSKKSFVEINLFKKNCKEYDSEKKLVKKLWSKNFGQSKVEFLWVGEIAIIV